MDFLERLLESIKPLCSDDEFIKIAKQAKDFSISIAPRLQKILEMKSWWATNYVTDWW